MEREHYIEEYTFIHAVMSIQSNYILFYL